MQSWRSGSASSRRAAPPIAVAHQDAMAQATNRDAEIVYLDAQGFIRVLDILHPNSPTVEWVSPVGGWLTFDLGDFNGDGDSEIVAVKGAAGSGQLIIYDPVITSGTVNSTQIINGIPWRILYDTPVTGRPLLVKTGELDASRAGDEIVYGTFLNAEDDDDTNDESRLVVLGAADAQGNTWTQLAEQTTSNREWKRLTIGDLDGVTPDELIVIDNEGTLEVFQLNIPTFTRILNNESDAREWLATTVARFFSVGLPGLVTGRSSSPGADSFLVFVYGPNDDGAFRDAHSEFFLPAPEQLFAGDINANGDEEVFFLRTVPSNITTLMRLVMRNRGTDTLPAFEQALDVDNGYQGGTAADVDADGRAEVIIMRDNRIRVYTQPEVDAALTDYTPPTTTDARTIVAGNLDQNGYLLTPSLTLSPATIQSALDAGEQSGASSFSLTNVGVGGNIPFTIRSTDNPAWLRVTGNTGQTPAIFTTVFDARLLTPGVYTTKLIIESSNTQVSNAPLQIAVTLTVRPGLTPRLLSVVATAPACAADSADIIIPLSIDGPTGMTFVAKILAGNLEQAAAATVAHADAGIDWPSALPWVSAQSTNSAPTTMQLTFRPHLLGSLAGNGTLELTAADASGNQIRRVPLLLLCAPIQLYLPLIAR